MLSYSLHIANYSYDNNFIYNMHACSFIIHSPDGLVEPAAVENGTYAKYDVVDVAGSCQVSCCLMIAMLFFVMNHEWKTSMQHYCINMHVTNLSLILILFIMQKILIIMVLIA